MSQAAAGTLRGDVLDPSALDPGTNLLVTGPVMTGKRRLLLSLLAAAGDPEDGVVLATTRKAGDTVVREFQSFAPETPAERIACVDCVGTGGRRGEERPWRRRTASDPGDLTGLGIGLTEFMRAFHHDPGAAAVGLHSLSTMLMYADLRRVFQFLHVITGRVSGSGFVGGFVLDDTTGDRERAILRQPFDALLEVRETEAGEREVRARGADVAPRRWTALPTGER
jgi:hypothetical protein